MGGVSAPSMFPSVDSGKNIRKIEPAKKKAEQCECKKADIGVALGATALCGAGVYWAAATLPVTYGAPLALCLPLASAMGGCTCVPSVPPCEETATGEAEMKSFIASVNMSITAGKRNFTAVIDIPKDGYAHLPQQLRDSSGSVKLKLYSNPNIMVTDDQGSITDEEGVLKIAENNGNGCEFPDAGVAGSDAGINPDGGTVNQDAGTEDAGADAQDAGAANPDAGIADAGSRVNLKSCAPYAGHYGLVPVGYAKTVSAPVADGGNLADYPVGEKILKRDDKYYVYKPMVVNNMPVLETSGGDLVVYVEPTEDECFDADHPCAPKYKKVEFNSNGKPSVSDNDVDVSGALKAKYTVYRIEPEMGGKYSNIIDGVPVPERDLEGATFNFLIDPGRPLGKMIAGEDQRNVPMNISDVELKLKATAVIRNRMGEGEQAMLENVEPGDKGSAAEVEIDRRTFINEEGSYKIRVEVEYTADESVPLKDEYVYSAVLMLDHKLSGVPRGTCQK